MKSRFDDAFRRQIKQALNRPEPAPAPTPQDNQFAQAVAHHQAGQLPQAEALYRQVLEAAPNHAGALNMLGVIALQCGQPEPALELIDGALQIDPRYPEAHFNRGNVLRTLGRNQAALESFDAAIRHKPEFAEAYCNRGTTLYLLEQHQAALESFDKAIQLKPDFAEAHCNRGSVLHLLQQHESALQSYDNAIRLKPEYAEAYASRGNALYALEHYQAALESCDRALLLKPQSAEAHFGRGTALYAMQRYQLALESLDQAIQLRPHDAEAHNNRGNVLLALMQYQAALASYDHALHLKPTYAEAHNNRGHLLQIVGRYHAALESLDHALHLKPEYPEAQYNRDYAINALRRHTLLHPGYDSAQETEAYHAVLREAARLEAIAAAAAPDDKPALRAELDALPLDLRAHPILCAIANANFIRTESSGNDLVFVCGHTMEQWNPDTARTHGIGGSEEAVIWLSRLLHQRGWNVTVYANCGAEQHYDGVYWRPWWLWNSRDRQDITVIWRHPLPLQYQINSAKIVLDLHDVVAESEFTPDRLGKLFRIFVKSKFHRALLPRIPDEKFAIVPNGIDAALFQGNAARDPTLLINTSSADRSLAAFLDCFEEIKQHVPNARAQWAYGWGQWDTTHASNPRKSEWKGKMLERIQALGVEARGRLSHNEVAELYRTGNIFFYPSEMAEIDCISLSKAMAAGAIPLTTDFAALGEKAGHGGIFIHSQKTCRDWAQPHQFHFEITDPDQKTQFIREAVKLLLHPPPEAERERMRAWARDTFDWHKVADAWHQALIQPPPTPAPAPVSVPAPPEILFAQAVAHHQAGQLPQAEALYRQILEAAPNHAGALHLLGVIASQFGHHEPAIELIDRAIQITPQYPDAHFNRGKALFALGRNQAALKSYDQAIHCKQDYAEAYCNRGSVLYRLQQYDSAVQSFDRAIELKPQFAEAHHNRGSALNAMHQYQAALASFDKAIQLRPQYTDAYSSRGNTLYLLQQYQSALESWDHALLLQPDNAEAHFGRGTALYAIEQYQSALQSLDKAIQLKPLHEEAHNNRGNVLLALMQYQAALESYDRAIQLKPDYVEAFANRGHVLQILEQYQAAIESYDQAFQLNPNFEYLEGTRLHMRRFLCDWNGTESACRHLEARIAHNEKAAYPFAMLSISGSPALQRQAAEICVRDKAPARATAAFTRRPTRDKIRIGYFSADYFNHPTSYLMAEVFERHHRDRFEVLGFSFGPPAADEMSRRVSAAMDQFLDIRSITDREVANLSRRLQLDIAVDLKGHTRDNRAGIFAHRAAPIQVSYLGYPGTMGAAYIDYLIADPTLIPESSRQYYSEKIIYLPDSYQCNDSRRAISTRPCSRAAEGLPPTAFVFCCFNNAYKITPEVFDIWMRILAQVEGSVLWLLEHNPQASENLRSHAQRRGIAPHRLVFAKPLPLDEHLARHTLADLFLDTLPYNAHTTASDALWTGLPVLTRMGETFAGRVAASLLRAVHLPELITATGAQFEALAVELAHNPERLQTLRHRLERNRPTAPLFDSQAFTHHLEAAYTAILERHDAGLPPGHILIPHTSAPAPPAI
jgi:predicted O-linked N-acetylglucosamine transferase (SPINDLY family)